METQKTFEECYSEIDKIVEKLRKQWTFKATVIKDFDDVKSEIITHIWKKWHLYDQARPLGGWAATTAKHQFFNILRNIYLVTGSPCLRCPCNLGNSMCSIYGQQGIECALYKKWYFSKRHAHDVKMPLPLENHAQEVSNLPDVNGNLETEMEHLHFKLKDVLTKSEWEIYYRLYILHKSDEETAKELGFKTSENGRPIGYKRLMQVKAIIVKKARKLLKAELKA